MCSMISIGFFFQAEDGIRDGTVTGVQTCALPILGGDCRRVGSGYPQCFLSAHSFKSDDRILERVFICMAYVENPRDIVRGKHDRERLFVALGKIVWIKKTAFFPKLVDSFFCLFWVVWLQELLIQHFAIVPYFCYPLSAYCSLRSMLLCLLLEVCVGILDIRPRLS